MSVFVIAEAGVNHNGSERIALELIEVAKRCGADAVKFQSFNARKLIIKGTDKAEYQKTEADTGDQYSMLKQLEISESMHIKLAKHCKDVGIEFMSTPFDIDAAESLVSLGMLRIKISSAEITNHPFLKHLATLDLPLILSTGMASLSEVVEAVNVIKTTRAQHGFNRQLSEVLALLHCTSNYPAELSDVNLRAMITMRDELKLPVGYSDHTSGILVSVAAVAMGALIIEKHYTLDREMSGPDHKASLEPDDFSEMVRQIRCVEQALGSSVKAPMESELPVRELVRRSIVMDRPKVLGETIAENDVVFLRPGSGIPPKELSKILGMRLKRTIQTGEVLQWHDLE